MELTTGERENLTSFLWIKQGDFMQEVDPRYETMIQDPTTLKNVKIEIYDTLGVQLIHTFEENKILSLSTERSLFSEDTFCIGSCACGEIDLEFFPTDQNGNEITIPTMAMIKPYYCLWQPSTGSYDDVYSEWVQKGVFFIDTRSINKTNGALKIHGFDAMLKAENDYPSGDAEITSDMSIIEKIAQAMGIGIDPRTYSVITGNHNLGLPIGYSQRELLSGIAAMYCANFCISDFGDLLAVKAVPTGTPISIPDIESLDSSPAVSFSQVVVSLDENNQYVVGDETGATLEVTIPFGGSQQDNGTDVATEILTALNGFSYVPYTAENAKVDPAIELGDPVIINNTVTSAVYRQKLEFDHFMWQTIEAPHKSEIVNEYKFETTQDRVYNRRFGKLSSQISQTAQDITMRFDNEFDDIHAYIRFSEMGMELGEENNRFKTLITKEKISFFDGDTEVAYVANNQFLVPHQVVQEVLDLGGYRLDCSDGVQFKWIGREVSS